MIINYGLKLEGNVSTNGAFSLTGSLGTGSFTLDGNILCNTTVTNVDVPDYSGPYTVTPTQQTQTLNTKDTVLRQNVVVNPIPSNYGLITWNGSYLTVS